MTTPNPDTPAAITLPPETQSSRRDEPVASIPAGQFSRALTRARERLPSTATEDDETLEAIQREVARQLSGLDRHSHEIRVTVESPRRPLSDPPPSTRDRVASLLKRRSVIAILTVLLSGGGSSLLTEGRIWYAAWVGVQAFADALAEER